MSLKVNALTKSYGSQKAVDNITFEVRKGEVVGFIGPNGSGKSTTMKCICGILPPDQGTLEVSGIDVRKDPMSVKKIIGFLSEHNPLYQDMYVREYLQHIAGYYPEIKNKNKQTIDIIEKTGLTPECHKKIGQLSKGYKQRVGLAQAMIHNPEVLILDEPTTGLDPNQIIEIRGLISGLSKDKTVLLSTHILQEVEAICDRVVIINNGKIVADGSADNIRQSTDEDFQTIYVEFNSEISEMLLKKIEGISEIRQLSPNTFLLAGKTKADLRESIFHFALNNKVTLLTIQKKEDTLEDSFRKLTVNK
jgi:ABC-2 type transport system ATP-binding protein